jgi:hypothetical protein
MSVIPYLASSLNRRDEIPNQELAKKIAAEQDTVAVKELAECLRQKKRDVQNDCIKVLYEIGYINPSLIAPYAEVFIELLGSPNNRLQWGCMTAIHAITAINSQQVYQSLPAIIEAADKGSVITNDYAVHILIALCSVKQHEKDAFSLLIKMLAASPTNQLPMYAEKTLPIAHANNKQLLAKVLHDRLGDIEKDSKRKRVEKVIKQLTVTSSKGKP